MVVFLLLGVIWAAVLVPPWLQSRREARPIASMRSFRSQLWSLERATPHYGADSYTTYVSYGDDLYGDVPGEPESDGAPSAGYEPDPRWSDHDGPVARHGVAPVHAFPAVAAVPPGRRRTPPYRRRRQVLSVLALAALGGVGPAVALGGPWVVVEAVAGTLLAVYVGLLIRRGRREVERAQKVRYLTPIRAPRPSVVVIGSGTAP